METETYEFRGKSITREEALKLSADERQEVFSTLEDGSKVRPFRFVDVDAEIYTDKDGGIHC